MKICHVCNFECEENAELCPICGAYLINEAIEEIEPEAEEKVIIDPVLLATIEDVVSAEIFKDILIDNKIAFSCDDDEDTGMKVIFGGGFASCDIYVGKSQYDNALSLYEEFLNSEADFDGDFSEIFDEEQ